MKTIVFEDKGQDFLEWDINAEGEVIASRPFQGWLWRGFKVRNIEVGKQPMFLNPNDLHVWRLLNYKVEAIKESINEY